MLFNGASKGIQGQTWKKLQAVQAVQAALADILWEIPILRTFWGKYSMILSEDRGRRLKDEDLGFIKGT